VAAARRDAYSRLLAAAAMVGHVAHTLHFAMEVRSGLVEGANVLIGARKAIDPLDLHRTLRQDLEPVYDAWSRVWTVGTPEAIRLANEMVNKSVDVMSAATVPGAGRSRMMRVLSGEKWTPEQLAAWDEQIRKFALARRAFAEQARRELGMAIAELMTAAPDAET